MNNSNLKRAYREKNDEFYTQYRDIENEVQNYWRELMGKIIYCNCDNESSKFFRYFRDNFKRIGIKKLIVTGKGSEKIEILDDGREIKSNIGENIGFDSPKCIDILKESDIIITNPPFSLFRKFISTLVEYREEISDYWKHQCDYHQGGISVIR